MEEKFGIWLDAKCAYIISSEEPQSIQTITSNADFRERVEGEGRPVGRFGDQFVNHERQHERKIEQQLDDYVERIVESLDGADSIVVFGPSTAKVRLRKAILEDHNLKDKLLAVETADSMTENQMKAWVREFYAKS